MKPEPDAIAVDLISRLTKVYSESLWRYVQGSSEYDRSSEYCTACQANGYIGDFTVHNDNCPGVKLIIESLNYIGTRNVN